MPLGGGGGGGAVGRLLSLREALRSRLAPQVKARRASWALAAQAPREVGREDGDGGPGYKAGMPTRLARGEGAPRRAGSAARVRVRAGSPATPRLAPVALVRVLLRPSAEAPCAGRFRCALAQGHRGQPTAPGPRPLQRGQVQQVKCRTPR